jgi:hypothetical protein
MTLRIRGDLKKDIRMRLLAFPDVCLKAQEAEGGDAILLDYEIRKIKNALKGIADDQYYRIIPDIYFHKLSRRKVAFCANCDESTVWRNEQRLLGRLALLLYGAMIWDCRWSPAAIKDDRV